MANTYLSRTFSTPTNGKKFTFSAWMKRSSISGDQAFFSTATGTPITTFRWNSDNKIYLFQIVGSSMVWEFATNALYRDVNGWYHLVIAFDSTENSAGDRLKLWINGEQVTSWSTQVNPALDMTPTMNTAIRHDVANNRDGNYFNGSMSHVHFIDGTAYDATAFGQYDANGVWTINTSPSVTYGNNGFFILKDGNSVTDQSGNSNNWTVAGGTLTNTEDNPSNVFAVINALDTTVPTANPVIISNGNTVLTGTNGTGIVGACATIAVSQGKYYFEVSRLGTANYAYVGVVKPGIGSITNITGTLPICSYRNNGSTYSNLSVGTQDTWNTDGDIIMCAMDMDNGAIYFGKNGSWLNSGNPLSGATQTGAFGSFTPNSSDYYAPVLAGYNNTTGLRANFGNGYFGTTAVASAGTNASGIGIFEYDVPTGYTALSTKGLNL